LTELLKQDQFQPLSVEKQVLVLFAGTNGYLDAIDVSECRRYERELLGFVETNYSSILTTIREKKAIDDNLRAEIVKALEAFKERFTVSSGAVAAD
jgi:F-type H+-transporting ATPase subunit alpha